MAGRRGCQTPNVRGRQAHTGGALPGIWEASNTACFSQMQATPAEWLPRSSQELHGGLSQYSGSYLKVIPLSGNMNIG
eukprot:3603815-Amphidinium_carterae.1